MFLNDCIIYELSLKNGKVFLSTVVRNHKELEFTLDKIDCTFNHVELVSSPIPGFILSNREFLGTGDEESPDIEMKYVCFILGGDVSYFRTIENDGLTDREKTLLLTSD